MEISTYWVGDVPPPLTIDIRDQRGRLVNLTDGLNSYEAVLIRGRVVNKIPASALNSSAASVGRFVLTWPSKSLFTQRGEYRLQIRMTGPGRAESTTTHIIKVKEAGKD